MLEDDLQERTCLMADSAAFYVDDMTCGHCERTVREALVEHFPDAVIDIDLGTHMVVVANMTADGDTKAAEAAIRDAGYSPVLMGH